MLHFFVFFLFSELYRFSPTGLMSGPSPHHHLTHHTHHSHPAIVTPGVRQDLHTDSNHRYFTEFYVDYFFLKF